MHMPSTSATQTSPWKVLRVAVPFGLAVTGIIFMPCWSSQDSVTGFVELFTTSITASGLTPSGDRVTEPHASFVVVALTTPGAVDPAGG